MKKAVWITLIVSLILVNLGSWLAYQFTGFNIPMMLRLALVMGITFCAAVLVGSYLLVNKMDEEQPLTRRPGKVGMHDHEVAEPTLEHRRG